MAAKIRDIVRFTLKNHNQSTPETPLHFTFQVVVMGPASVGKTCIIERLVLDAFKEEYEPTGEGIYHREFSGKCTKFSKNVKIHLDILDIGSQARKSEKTLAIFTGNVFLLVYDVNEKESYEEMRAMKMRIISQKKTEDVPILILGNKSDVDVASVSSRVKMNAAVEATVLIHWRDEYLRVSAKTDFNIQEIFVRIFDLLNIGFLYTLPPNQQRCPMTNKWKYAGEMFLKQRALAYIAEHLDLSWYCSDHTFSCRRTVPSRHIRAMVRQEKNERSNELPESDAEQKPKLDATKTILTGLKEHVSSDVEQTSAMEATQKPQNEMEIRRSCLRYTESVSKENMKERQKKLKKKGFRIVGDCCKE